MVWGCLILIIDKACTFHISVTDYQSHGVTSQKTWNLDHHYCRNLRSCIVYFSLLLYPVCMLINKLVWFNSKVIIDSDKWQIDMYVCKSRRMRWVSHMAHMWDRRGAYRVLLGRPEEKRPLGRRGHRYKHNIKMHCQEAGWGGMGWIDLD